MAVPYTFGTATAAIPLSNIDSNFATTITLGNTAIQLGNTVTTLNNITLSNATVSSLSTPITPAQGGTGLATLTANNVMLGNGTSNVTFVAPGTSGNVLASNGTVWVSQAAAGGLTSGTMVASTSGTSITFSSLPSTVKRITLMLQGVSTNGSADYLVRIGAGSVTTSGYLGSAAILGTTGTVQNFTAGFGIISNVGYQAASVFHGMIVIALVGSNNWVANYVLGISNAAPVFHGGFSLALGGTLDRVVLTTTNGTDTFDAGNVNILYE